MSKINMSKTVPAELTENELGDVRGGAKVTALCMDTITKKSTAVGRKTDGNTGDANDDPLPTFDYPEDFAP